MKRSSFLIAVLILCLTAIIGAQERRGGYNRPATTMDSSPKMFDTKDYKIRVVTIAENLVYPYCFTFLPDGSALVVESEGRLRVVKDGKLQPEAIAGLPQVYFVGGQAGLMDVALHPKFAQNHLVYFTYNKPGEKGATMAIGRGKLDGNQLTEVKDVYVAEAWGKANGHLSARMAFDREGLMYMALADHNLLEDVQKPNSDVGKVLRMHDDGTGREIYTFGHRNPHALVLDPKTKDFWEVEHGDEINVIKAGANYGWPWVSSGEGDPIGPPPAGAKLVGPYLQQFPVWNISGLTIYNGDKFPKWKGNIFVGGLSTQRIERVVTGTDHAASHEPLFMTLGQRVRDVRTGPDGYIYFTTDDAKGRFMRVEPVAAVNAN